MTVKRAKGTKGALPVRQAGRRAKRVFSFGSFVPFDSFGTFQRGFTLIELLVVVAIIGVLSALLLSNFVGVRQRARDAQRKSDLRQIQSALELYRADIGSYPSVSGTNYYLNNNSTTSGNNNPCPTSAPLTDATGKTIYMQKIPCDPMGISYYNNGNYFYNSNGATYTLGACLENLNDSDQNDTSTSPGNTGSNQCGSAGAKLFFVLTNP